MTAVRRPPQPRRTQTERRAATRAALLAAALDQLVDGGLGAFTTTEVCRRAGVSQGALFKHFASKSALLAAVTEHLFDGLRGDFEAAFLALPPRRRSLRRGLDLLWDQMADPRLAAAYELYTAARTDAELRDDLAPVVEAHVERIAELAVTLVGADDSSSPELAGAVDLAILAIQGLVLNQMALPDPAQERRLRRTLSALLSAVAASLDEEDD